MIESDFLSELEQLTQSFDRTVDAVYAGSQESLEVGEGQTFSDHRKYTPGDDIRLVDWQVLARTDEVYIKRFEAERELTVHVLVDTSASMDFGDREGGTHKFEFAAKLGLGVGYLAAETQNDFRISGFTATFDRLDRDASNRSELIRLIDQFNDTDPDGEADFKQALRSYASTINTRSLVVVISDFLDEPEDIRSGLQMLAEHDTIAVQVVAPEERDLPVDGDAVFRDLEDGGRSLRAYFGGRVKQRYQERFEAHLQAVESACQRVGATHIRIDNDSEFFDGFADLWLAISSDRER